ncbi:MAG: 4-(cytidine 5'-diphospho)-2-C-methyl-D-erythritol kinase [Prevotella sp.]|nr:4-(cytidine 5'-diphospho)-2-C-methyl-D-erythritol kinase [Prevotella sp.]
MIVFPCAKINLGLNVVSKRSDGYHDLQTVFHPIPLYDALEVLTMDDGFPSASPCDLLVSGMELDGNNSDNLVVRAYNLLANDFKLPRVHIHLYKNIPSQAGLGGGSSDAAFMIKLLDEKFKLDMGLAEMERYAARLGADCPFFISAEPSYATGIGDELSPVDAHGSLTGYHLLVVKPPVAVSTREAYAAIKPRMPKKTCREIVHQPIATWRDELTNDFEESVFAKLPELAEIKDKLYDLGAVYAQMSGSGSALFGIYNRKPTYDKSLFAGCQVYQMCM